MIGNLWASDIGISRLRAAVPLLLAGLAFAGPREALGQEEPPQPTQVVRVGWAPSQVYEGQVGDTSTLATIREQLTAVADSSLEFTLSIGNDYQIVSWVRDGLIDAAILSPFAAALLEDEGVVVPLMELVGGGRSEGRRSMVAVSLEDGQEESPQKVWREFLTRVLTLAEKRSVATDPDSIRADRIRSDFAVLLTSHLSTAGFVAPLLHARDWVRNTINERNVQEPAETLRHFWDLFFDGVVYTFGDVETLELKPGVRTLVFGDTGSGLEDTLVAGRPLGEWRPIDPEGIVPDPADTLVLPHDLFVMRSDVVCGAFGVPASDGRSPEECAAGVGRVVDRIGDRLGEGGAEGRYRAVRAIQKVHHVEFRERVAELAGPDGPLGPQRYERWFRSGHFEFRVDEVVHLLRQGRRRGDGARLALVLPGGGVKSVYQAGLIEHLYRNCDLTNSPPETQRPCPGGVDSPGGPETDSAALHVRTVIGTSGGAMVGFLTALGPELHPDSTRGLAKSVAETASHGVFHPFDLLRWMSLVILMVILMVSIAPLEPLPDERTWDGVERRINGGAAERILPMRHRVFSLWPLIAFPVIVRITGLGVGETVRVWEGSLFGFTLLLVHLVLTSFRLSGRTGSGAPLARSSVLLRSQSTALIYLGVFLVFMGIAGTYAVGRPFLRAGHPLSVLATAGIVCMYLGQIFRVWGGQGRVRVVALDQWLSGVAVVVGLMATVFAILGLAGRPLLELTGEYWVSLIAIAAVVFSATALWTSRPERARPLGHWGQWLRMRLLWLSSADGAGSVLSTPGSRLLALGAAGGLAWGVGVVPAMYGNASALARFQDVAEETRDSVFKVESALVGDSELLAASVRPGDLKATLIVTGTLLRDEVVAGGTRVIPQGEIYFCFEGPVACPDDGGSRWHTQDQPDWGPMVDAVFASGSPFPVLPAHRTPLSDGTEVSLVDGAFTHNVPYAAALLSGANQVLAIRSSPYEEELGGARGVGSVASPLTQGLGRVFGFLFSRAQELDRAQARGMLVASLAPESSQESFPALTSFTDETVEMLEDQAKVDLEQDRRIGRVESWGEPFILEIIARR